MRGGGWTEALYAYACGRVYVCICACGLQDSLSVCLLSYGLICFWFEMIERYFGFDHRSERSLFESAWLSMYLLACACALVSVCVCVRSCECAWACVLV